MRTLRRARIADRSQVDGRRRALLAGRLRFRRLLICAVSLAGPVGEGSGDSDPERVFRDEGRNASDARPERLQGRAGALIVQFGGAEGFGSTFQRAAQAVERQVALGQNFAPRLKISERVKRELFVVRARGVLAVEESSLLRHERLHPGRSETPCGRDIYQFRSWREVYHKARRPRQNRVRLADASIAPVPPEMLDSPYRRRT